VASVHHRTRRIVPTRFSGRTGGRSFVLSITYRVTVAICHSQLLAAATGKSAGAPAVRQVCSIARSAILRAAAHIRADSPLLQLAAAWNACRARILAPTVGHGRQLPTICRIFAAALHSLAARTNASTGEHDSPRRGGFNILISKYIFLIAPEGADRSLTARTYWNVTPTCRIIVATQSGAALEGRRESKGMRISCDR
jgi:hypothetical protein